MINSQLCLPLPTVFFFTLLRRMTCHPRSSRIDDHQTRVHTLLFMSTLPQRLRGKCLMEMASWAPRNAGVSINIIVTCKQHNQLQAHN